MLHIGQVSAVICSGAITHGARRKKRVLDLSLTWIFHEISFQFVYSFGQASSHSVLRMVSTLI